MFAGVTTKPRPRERENRKFLHARANQSLNEDEMTSRAGDWLAQARRDLEQAEASRKDERHEWACFASQQSAEKAAKALHLALGRGDTSWRGCWSNLPSNRPRDW